MSLSYFVRYFALGFGCCLAMLAVAAVTAFALVQTQGDALDAGPDSATPTPLQLKQALEYMAANGPAQVSPAQSGGSSAGGGGAGAAATSTPGTPEAAPLRGGDSTPAPANSSTAVTPQPTTTSNSVAIPTRTPFSPPTIVPIQPLAPTPTSVQPAAPATSIGAQPIAPAATSVPPQPQSTPSR